MSGLQKELKAQFLDQLLPDDKDELERAYQYSARLVGDQKKLPLVARAIFPGKALERSRWILHRGRQ